MLPQLVKAVTKWTFYGVSRLRSPDTAIHGNSTYAMSQHAARATNARNVALQSAAPATRKRRACIDTLPKHGACDAQRETDLPPKRKNQQFIRDFLIQFSHSRRNRKKTSSGSFPANTGPDPNYLRYAFMQRCFLSRTTQGLKCLELRSKAKWCRNAGWRGEKATPNGT